MRLTDWNVSIWAHVKFPHIALRCHTSLLEMSYHLSRLLAWPYIGRSNLNTMVNCSVTPWSFDIHHYLIVFYLNMHGFVKDVHLKGERESSEEPGSK